MADVIFPKRVPTQRDLDTPPIPEDYRPSSARMRASSHDDAGYDDGEEYDGAGEFHAPDSAGRSANIASHVDLHKLERELIRNPLSEIATMMRSLTYGEMMELAQAIWKIRPEGESVDQDSLPMLLHRWSTSSEH